MVPTCVQLAWLCLDARQSDDRTEMKVVVCSNSHRTWWYVGHVRCEHVFRVCISLIEGCCVGGRSAAVGEMEEGSLELLSGDG